jgi:hypothetical protein
MTTEKMTTPLRTRDVFPGREGGMPAYTKEFPVPAVAALCKKMMKALQRHEDQGKSKAYFAALKNEVSSE